MLWGRQEEGKSPPIVLKPAVGLVWPLSVPLPLRPAVWWYYFQHERQSTNVLPAVSQLPHLEDSGPLRQAAGKQGLRLIPGNFMVLLPALLSAFARDCSDNKAL